MEKKITVKRGDKSADIFQSQLTVDNLRIIFKVRFEPVASYILCVASFYFVTTQVNPASTYLEEYSGGTVYFPNEEGYFHLANDDINEYTLLNVMCSDETGWPWV